MKIAGYSKISATASLISVNKNNKYCTHANKNMEGNKTRHKNNNLFNKTRIYNINDPDLTERKIYIQTFLNKYRLVGCVDSGSDLTLMHLSLYNKIKYESNSLEPSDIPHITSFSDNNIIVEGKLKCKLQLYREHQGIPVVIYVIPDIPNQTPFLLGNDLLRSGLGEISYSGSPFGTNTRSKV